MLKGAKGAKPPTFKGRKVTSEVGLKTPYKDAAFPVKKASR